MTIKRQTLRGLARSGIAAAVLVAMPAQAAQEAAQPCLSAADVQALAVYALPSAMDGLIERCSPQLAADGFLRRQGPALVASYKRGKQAAWPRARRALLQVASEKDPKSIDLIATMPDEALQPFVESMIGGMVATQLKPEQCGAAERVVRLLAPLPAANMAELAGLLFQLGATGKQKAGGLAVCKGPRGAGNG